MRNKFLADFHLLFINKYSELLRGGGIFLDTMSMNFRKERDEK